MYATSLLVLAVSLAGPPDKEAPKKDPLAIVGDWKLVGVTTAGKSLGPDDGLPNVVFEFAASGKYRTRVKGKADSEEAYTADPSKDPAEVDFSGDGKKQQAIYKVEKDTLTLCWDEDGGPRPTKFESPAGTRAVLMTFKRVQKKE